MRPNTTRGLASCAAVLSLLAAQALFAQFPGGNSAVRGTSSTPRYATQNRVGSAPSVRTESVASALTPFNAVCGDTAGTVYVNSEVEPHIAADPRNADRLIASWQQDRWSNGGAHGIVTAVSTDGGVTWSRKVTPFTACAGGTAQNGGSYERGTDPWVAISPDGTAYQVALSFTGQTFAAGSLSAVLVSRSVDGGTSWSDPVTLIRDGAGFFNDKETITADPTDSRFVYAAWDRLVLNGSGPAYMARSTDGGASWEPARAIYDPGGSNQTIGNLIRVLPDGTLVNFFTHITIVANQDVSTLRVIRSTDKGVTWSAPVTIATKDAMGARDPTNGRAIRDGSDVGQMAVAPDGKLYAVWQDARFTGLRDAIALSRSTDGGLTWSTPVRVNANPNVAAFTPQVHVRADGTVGVTYFDLRSDTAEAPLMTEYWLVRSSDAVNWTETRVSDAFDISLAPNAGGYFLGDYMGLTSAGTTFIAFYTRTTGSLANRTDAIATRLAAPQVLKAAYEAQPLPEADYGPDFRQAVADNIARNLRNRYENAP